MSDELWELKQRLGKLSDEQLIEIVTTAAKDYRQEAIDYAKEELKYRRVDLDKLSAAENEEDAPEADSVPEADPEPSLDPVIPRTASRKCFCGGALRDGTLVAEKELTIIYSDNREERFVRVLACTQCNQVSILVDPDTVVQD